MTFVQVHLSAALMALFALVIMPQAASAQALLDQEAVAEEDNGQLFISSSSLLAQTFTVGIGGILTGIEVKVSGGASTSTWEIHPTLNGEPVLGGPPLASGTISFDSPEFTPVYVPIDLTADNLEVELGEVLAIVTGDFMTTRLPGRNVFWHRLDGFYNNFGGRYFRAVPPLTEWLVFDTSIDMGFRTFVEPLPPTAGQFNFDVTDRSDRGILLYAENSGCTTTGVSGFADPDCTIDGDDADASFSISAIPAALTWSGDTATITVDPAEVESERSGRLGVSVLGATSMIFQFDVVTGALVGGHLSGAPGDYFFRADVPTPQGTLTFDWLNRDQQDRPFEGTVLVGTAFERQVVASCATETDALAPVDTNGMCFLQQYPAPVYNPTLNTFTVYAPRDALFPTEDFSPEFDTLDYGLAEVPTPVPSFGPPWIGVLLTALLASARARGARRVRRGRWVRRARRPGAAVILAGAFAFAVSPSPSHAEVFEGVYELGISETFAGEGEPATVTWHRTLRTATQRIGLPPMDDVPGFSHGATVRVEGEIVDGVLVTESIEAGGPFRGAGPVLAAMRAPAVPPTETLGAQRTLVTLLNFTNDLSQPTTAAEVTTFLLDEANPTSLSSYVEEASYGRASITGGAAGWIPVGYDDSLCQLWSTNGEQTPPTAANLVYALDPLIDYAILDRWIIIIPQNTNCGFAGYSSLGKETWDTDDGVVRFSRFILNGFNPSSISRVAAHEFGHSAGALQHSRDHECGTEIVGDRCSEGETAGDAFDVISQSVPYGHYSAPNKEALHWLDTNLVEVAPPGGTFLLDSFSVPTSGSPPTSPLALRIPVEWVMDDLRGASGYYVSYRTQDGFDSIFPALATDGAMIHLDGDFYTPLDPPATGATALLDLTPNADASQTVDSENVVLEIGETFNDVENGISIEVLGRVGDELEVEVVYSKYCGNGVFEPEIGEACDGADFGGETCSSVGFTGGSLGCSASCEVETLACSGTDSCGPGHEYDFASDTCTAEFRLDSSRRDIWRSSSDWDVVRAFGSGNPTTNYNYIYMSNTARPGFGNIYRNSLPFDTSSIPDGANLVSASLDLKILADGFPTLNTHPDSADQLVLVEATLSEPPVAIFSDFSTIGAVDSPIELAPRIDVGDVFTSGDTPIQFVLGSEGLDALDPMGFSYLGLRGGYDVDDVVVPDENNSLQLYLRSEASPIAGPRLTVVYDAVPEPGFATGLLVSGLVGRFLAGARRRRAAPSPRC
ncbi:MAG: hypothetical protein AB8G23_02605 [Myxococcota bacterium]